MTENNSASPVAVSFLFAEGKRPHADAIRLLSQSPADLFGFSISAASRPPEFWLEILSLGLTFDLTGLSPGDAAPSSRSVHLLGLDNDFDPKSCSVVRLQPASHIQGGRALLPIVRVMVGLAAELTRLDDVRAVAWEPSSCAIKPQSFASLGRTWLKGGAFPVGGLTSIDRTQDDRVRSRGLCWIAGHEVEIIGRRPAELGHLPRLLAKVLEKLTEPGELKGRAFLPQLGLEIVDEPTPGSPVLRLSRPV